MSINKINIVFMGNFLYPRGFAGTKRIQHTIDFLKGFEGLSLKVLLLRQNHLGRDESDLSGVHEGTAYRTIGHDIKLDLNLPMTLVKYYSQGFNCLIRYRKGGYKNIIYAYTEPNIENIFFLVFARLIGYKVIFDIVEDSDYIDSSPHFFSWIKLKTTQILTRRISLLSDAVIVISSHLRNKFERISKGGFPLFYLPVSVDLNRFNHPLTELRSPIRIMYSGTFAEKDGIDNLIAAFDQVCTAHDNVILVLTGMGLKRDMDMVVKKIEASSYRNRIDYKGYLDDEVFYRVLNNSDILCMTRSGSHYARAGFPFKLGEYLATGKPVIASDVTDVSRFVKDRESALLVEPDSVASISSALEFLISNPNEAIRIGANGRKVAEQYFDIRVIGHGLIQFIKDV
jgi:glycosyltransferase involved in cell wall biosynthesis